MIIFSINNIELSCSIFIIRYLNCDWLNFDMWEAPMNINLCIVPVSPLINIFLSFSIELLIKHHLFFHSILIKCLETHSKKTNLWFEMISGPVKISDRLIMPVRTMILTSLYFPKETISKLLQPSHLRIIKWQLKVHIWHIIWQFEY